MNQSRSSSALALGVCVLVAAVVLVAAQTNDSNAKLRAAFAKAHDPVLAWRPDQRELIDWAFAVQQWLIDAPGDPQAELAHGVLLSCLASPTYRELLYPDMLSKADREACSYTGPRAGEWTANAKGDLRAVAIVPPMPPILTTNCERVEKKALEKAPDSDAAGPEARLRLAYLAAEASPSKSGHPALLEIARSSSDPRYRFLASLFLGREAEAVGNLTGAAERYREAMAIDPSWPSAHQALAAVLLQEGTLDSVRSLLSAAEPPKPTDPWYGYACHIMTASVLTRLREVESKIR